MTGIHRLSAAGVIGAGPTPKTERATKFGVVRGSEEHDEILLEKRPQVAQTIRRVLLGTRDLCLLTNCHQHASVNALSQRSLPDK